MNVWLFIFTFEFWLNVLKLWMIYFQDVSLWWFLNFSSWDTIFCVHFFPFSVFLLRQFCDSAFSWCYVFSKVWKVNWPGLSGVAQECWSLKCGGVLQTAQIKNKKTEQTGTTAFTFPLLQPNTEQHQAQASEHRIACSVLSQFTREALLSLCSGIAFPVFIG